MAKKKEPKVAFLPRDAELPVTAEREIQNDDKVRGLGTDLDSARAAVDRPVVVEEFLKATLEKVPDDPWYHRSQKMRCATCMWFVLKKASVVKLYGPSGELGRCRRHAPTMNGYPVVFERDWCGDHKLDENKA